MRLIDADILKKEVLMWMPSDPCGIADRERPIETDIVVSLMMEIEDAPTIDAIEIVRCKDCKNRARYAVCDFLGEDGFCSNGERREDGEE